MAFTTTSAPGASWILPASPGNVFHLQPVLNTLWFSDVIATGQVEDNVNTLYSFNPHVYTNTGTYSNPNNFTLPVQSYVPFNFPASVDTPAEAISRMKLFLADNLGINYNHYFYGTPVSTTYSGVVGAQWLFPVRDLVSVAIALSNTMTNVTITNLFAELLRGLIQMFTAFAGGASFDLTSGTITQDDRKANFITNATIELLLHETLNSKIDLTSQSLMPFSSLSPFASDSVVTGTTPICLGDPYAFTYKGCEIFGGNTIVYFEIPPISALKAKFSTTFSPFAFANPLHASLTGVPSTVTAAMTDLLKSQLSNALTTFATLKYNLTLPFPTSNMTIVNHNDTLYVQIQLGLSDVNKFKSFMKSTSTVSGNTPFSSTTPTFTDVDTQISGAMGTYYSDVNGVNSPGALRTAMNSNKALFKPSYTFGNTNILNSVGTLTDSQDLYRVLFQNLSTGQFIVPSDIITFNSIGRAIFGASTQSPSIDIATYDSVATNPIPSHFGNDFSSNNTLGGVGGVNIAFTNTDGFLMPTILIFSASIGQYVSFGKGAFVKTTDADYFIRLYVIGTSTAPTLYSTNVGGGPTYSGVLGTDAQSRKYFEYHITPNPLGVPGSVSHWIGFSGQPTPYTNELVVVADA